MTNYVTEICSNNPSTLLLILLDMADPLEHATGLERKELEAIKKGNPVRSL